MEGLKVKCRSCGLVLYETTEFFNCHKPLTGDMLRLMEPFFSYNWPTYDGSLAVKSTSRFLMFCSQCSGYISPTGVLDFVDFPDSGVSKERSEMSWGDEPKNDNVDSLIISDAEDSAPKDDIAIDPQPMTPGDVIKKIEKEVTFPRNKRSKKGKRR